MLHPNTEVRFINDKIGYGIFATSLIPKGTITFVKDPLDIEITQDKLGFMSESLQEIVEKYSYIDERGIKILSWDNAKYMNHRCECNTLSTGYGFEIAIMDIEEGEEITDDYGLFNLEYDFEVDCGCRHCRKKISANDLDKYWKKWDYQIRESLCYVDIVSQPLWKLLDYDTSLALMEYISGGAEYSSVRNLKYSV